jgi:multicomponent Na+:H+ antiporter subunit D
MPQMQTGQPDYWAVALIAALLTNAILTLIAGTRLWSHIFWRPGHEGVFSEHPNISLTGLTRRQVLLGLSPVVALAGLIAVAGVWPGPMLQASLDAANGLIDPQAYVDAVGLEARP